MIGSWKRRKERKSEEMEEITFDFELLGSVTLSLPSVSASARSSSSPLPSSSRRTASLSLRDSSIRSRPNLR